MHPASKLALPPRDNRRPVAETVPLPDVATVGQLRCDRSFPRALFCAERRGPYHFRLECSTMSKTGKKPRN